MYLTVEGAVVVLGAGAAILLAHAVALLIDGARWLVRRFRAANKTWFGGLSGAALLVAAAGARAVAGPGGKAQARGALPVSQVRKVSERTSSPAEADVISTKSVCAGLDGPNRDTANTKSNASGLVDPAIRDVKQTSQGSRVLIP